MITVQELSCRMSGRMLFDGISFSIPRGSYTVLVGPNGAGKTTLLRCLDRILDDWTGVIKIDGRDIRTYSRIALSRRVALLNQRTGDIPLTVRQYITCARYPYLNRFSPLSKHDEEAVESGLAMMRLESLAERPCRELSGGERQKVFLTAALVQDPQVLLLDEPTTFLDYRHQAEITALLLGWARRNGTTVLEVTHDLNHAAAFATSIMALARGKIIFHGPPKQLMTPEILASIYDFNLALIPRSSGVPVAVVDKSCLPKP
ncbi:MAG: ABC transporter ATP-binding protein [Planctomycetia bacterium]|nr:ABC transporter ATP-binding protein [Planctomycetia bacterium]